MVYAVVLWGGCIRAVACLRPDIRILKMGLCQNNNGESEVGKQ